MKTEARMLLALAASMGIFFVWQRWFVPPPAPVVAPSPVVTESATADPAAATSETPSLDARQVDVDDPQASIESTTVRFETGRGVVTLSNDGGVPTAWTLNSYEEELAGEVQPIDVVTSQQAPPLRLHLEGLPNTVPAMPRYRVMRRTEEEVEFLWTSADVELVKRYTFRKNSYLSDLTVEIRNRSGAPLQGRLGVDWGAENAEAPKKKGFLSAMRPPENNAWTPFYYSEGSVEREQDRDELMQEVVRNGGIQWAGLESRYFIAALLPRERSDRMRFVGRSSVDTVNGTDQVTTALYTAPFTIPARGTLSQKFTLYVGPKEIKALKAAGSNLDSAIDYGMFSVVAVPILYLLKFFYGLIQNYGIAIILMTIFIKILLHPITKASLQSMRKMQLLQPDIKALREKFKDNKERLNAETMQLFKTNKVNPMSGCLPMLLQIPVYIALYKVLWNSVELYRAPFFWFYTDLSAPDPYYISPLLLGVAFFLQQKLTPSPTADPAQKKIMMLMPLMFTGFMLFLPSGLVIYIFVNTAFSVLQQWLTNRGLGFRDLFRGQLTPKVV